jgi:hypothetical protein
MRDGMIHAVYAGETLLLYHRRLALDEASDSFLSRIHSRAHLSLTSLNGMAGIGLLPCLSAANIERGTSRC